MASALQYQPIKVPALDTSGQLDQYTLSQKQKLIDALRQQAMNPPAMQQTSVVPRQSLITPIVQALSGYLATKKQDQLNSQEQQFGQQQDQKRASALAGLLGGNAQSQPDQSPQSVVFQPQQQDQGQSPPLSLAMQGAMGAPSLQAAPPQQSAPQQAPAMAAPSQDESFNQSMLKANAALANGVPEDVVKAYIAKAQEAAKPTKYEFGVDGTIRDSGTGVIMDADKHPLTDAQFLQRRQDIAAKDDKPNDEMSKLNADLKNGFISQADYNLRKNLITTRAPNMYSTPGAPDQLDSVAQMVGNYEIAPPSSMRMQTPQGLALMSRVKAMNPDYQAQEFASRNAAYRAFGSGKQGDQVRSFNVLISHLNTASDLANNLDNTASPAFNKAANYFATQTGSAEPTNLDTAMQMIKAEAVKAISGAGGGVADRENALAAVNSAISPAAMRGALDVVKKLAGGQLGGLKRQFEQSTGRKDFENLLSPDALPYLQTREAQGNENANNVGGPKKISSDADYAALRSGDEFIGPDGKHRRKP